MISRFTALRFLLLVALPLFGSPLVFSQDLLSRFLLSAEQAHEVKSIDAQMSYLAGKPYRLQPVQKLEFRTESNQLDRNRQDYALRVNPANPWEMRNNNQYFRAYASMLAYEKGMILEEALYERYLLLVDLSYHEELRAIKASGSALVDAYLTVLEKQQYSTFFDGEDYVKLKLDQIDRSVEIEEEAFQRDDVLRQMKGFDPAINIDDPAWHIQKIISLEDVLKIVDSAAQSLAQAPSMLYYDKLITLATREYSLEKSNINLGFVQAQYQEYRVEQGRRPWSISMGVTIPVFNPNKGDMAKRQLEVLENEHEKLEVQSEMETASARAREQIRSLMSRYNSIQEKIRLLQVSTLTGTLKAMEGNNPAVQIRLSGNILKLQVIALKLKQSILYAYVEFLTHTDLIQRRPLVNYLSPTLEVMEP